MGHLARQSDQIPFAVSILVNLPFLSISPHFDSSLTPICHFLQFLQKIDIKQLVWQVFYGLLTGSGLTKATELRSWLLKKLWPASGRFQ